MKKRLYFILSGENLFHPHYFSGVVMRLKKKDYQIVGITIPKERYSKGILYFIKQQIALWGLIGFFYIAIIDRIKSIFSSIETLANAHSIPVIRVGNINGKEHIDYLKNFNIDIIISSQGQIFKEEILNLPKIACINRHTSLLPMYGGSMPVFWAMHNEEKNFGVSMHYMVKKVDAGDILYQETLSLNKNNSLFKNYIIAFDKSIDATLFALYNLEKRKLVKKFHLNDKQYFSYPSFDKVKEFKQKHKTFSLSDMFYFLKAFQIIT